MTLKRKQKASLPIKGICITSIILFALFWPAVWCEVQALEHKGGTDRDDTEIGHAFKTRTSNVQVEGEGTVTRILADDIDGSRHQRFIVRLASGQTVLIAHNIDVAPRIATLQAGDSVGFYGEYVWNALGGKVHWTHHDPGGKHVAGWLKHKGRTYQ